MPAVILLGNGGGSGMNGGGTNLVLQNTFTSGSLVSSPGPTFSLTRATASTTTDFEGLVRSIASGEARFWKLRRIQNLYPSSAVATTQSITVVAGSYILSGSGTGTITLSGTGSGTLSPGGASTRKQLSFTPTAGTCTFTVAGSITNVQLELTAGSTIQIASTYRDSATSYGAGVNAVSYENTANGNSVDGSNVVTDATGAPLTLTAAGLLPFQSYTNLLLQSEAFDNASWTKINGTITADQTAAPNGLTTADKVKEDNTTSQHGALQGVTKAASAVTYDFVCFLKQSDRTWGLLEVSDAVGNGARGWFNLATGAVGSKTTFGTGFTANSVSIVAVANGFYQCTLNLTTNSATTAQPFVCTSTGDTTVSYTGTTGFGIFAWGAQLTTVAGAPYIATTTTAVTVNADVVTASGAGVINAVQGTIYVQALGTSDTSAARTLFQLDDGTANNLIALQHNTTNAERYIVTNGGVAQVAQNSAATTWNSGTSKKAAARYLLNDCNDAFDGTAGTHDTSCTIPTVTTFRLGDTVTPPNAVVQSVQYLTAADTDAQLQSITT